MFLCLCFFILSAKIAFSQQQCCNQTTAENCILSTGKVWNPSTCTCSCNPSVEAQCIALNRIFNSSSCTCEGCNSSVASYCNSPGRVLDPNTCQCGGCDSMLANQCTAQNGIWHSSDCTCEIVSNPCDSQYLTTYLYSLPITMSQCCFPAMRCYWLYTQYTYLYYGYNNVFCGQGATYSVNEGYYSVPDSSCPCY